MAGYADLAPVYARPLLIKCLGLAGAVIFLMTFQILLPGFHDLHSGRASHHVRPSWRAAHQSKGRQIRIASKIDVKPEGVKSIPVADFTSAGAGTWLTGLRMVIIHGPSTVLGMCRGQRQQGVIASVTEFYQMSHRDIITTDCLRQAARASLQVSSLRGCGCIAAQQFPPFCWCVRLQSASLHLMDLPSTTKLQRQSIITQKAGPEDSSAMPPGSVWVT